MTQKPHIVVVVPRGEAVRNFIYSDTLRILSESARVTLLSVVTDPTILEPARPYVEDIIPLEEQHEHPLLIKLRQVIHYAHYRWLWSGVARNMWEWHDAEDRTLFLKARRVAWRTLFRVLANRPTLETLTKLENWLTWRLRPNDEFVKLFERLKPDVVFNGSHIHGPAGEFPAKIAHHMGIPTVGFVFSWDNLTSRSRIFVPYDTFFVWHHGMRDQLLKLYPKLKLEQVIITGTPQMDFHYRSGFTMSREELANKIGFDAKRPFILYTTGIAHHFPEEHRTVDWLIKLINEMQPKPQLVIRTYVKDTSPEMMALEGHPDPDVHVAHMQWDKTWFTPYPEDLVLYSSLIEHAALGINAASTVSLEMLMKDKPVINLGFDPPGSELRPFLRWKRHITFDHYWPVAQSGAVMVAYDPEDMRDMLHRGLTCPEEQHEARARFLHETFGDTLDGQSGRRVAERLIEIAGQQATTQGRPCTTQ
jgi:hypothetical protein